MLCKTMPGFRQGTFKTICAAAAVFLTTAGLAAACTPDYTIQRGDTLSGIALTQMGSIFDYPRIHERNRDVIGDNPDLIFAGTEIDIPCQIAHLEELDWSVMPTPEQAAWLMERARIQILDIRAPSKLGDGTLEGAITVPYALWAGPQGNPGGVPSEARLSEILSRAGLDLEVPVLIVHDKDNPMGTGRAARVYWLLKSSGASQLAILRGGFRGWVDAGQPVAATPAVPSPKTVEVQLSKEWHADMIEVYGVMTEQVPGHLLDARPHNMFAKFDNLGRALASTLPGASNAPAPPLMSALRGEIDLQSGAERVISYLQENDVPFGEDQSVISFCHTGELAALNWFYASELAALPGMKLYPDSIKGWTTAGGELAPGVADRMERLARKSSGGN